MASSITSGRRFGVGAYASSTSASILCPRSRSFCVTPRCPYPWIRARRSQSRISRAGTLAAACLAAEALPAESADDRGRRGMGRLPGRKRFQFLERAAERIRRGGEGDPEIPLSLGAEPSAGGEENAGLLENAGHEFHGCFFLGDASPQVERAAWGSYRTAERAERVQYKIAPLAIHAAQRRSVDRKGREPLRRGGLYGLRRAGIHVRLELYQSLDQSRSPHSEPDTPPRHVKRLREGVELDRAVAGSRDREDAPGRLRIVKLGIGRVAHDDEVAPYGPGDQLFVESVRSRGPRRVVGVVHEHQPGARRDQLVQIPRLRDESRCLPERK